MPRTSLREHTRAAADRAATSSGGNALQTIGGRVVATIKAVRAGVKAALWRPILRMLLASNRRAGLILLYHDVGDRDGDARSELVPPVSRTRFAQQLAHLKRYYRPVELADLPAAVAGRRRGEPFPVSLTFDDDLGHHVSHALPELASAQAPATFFLCGAFLDEATDFWWQRLQRAVDQGIDVTPLLGGGDIHKLGRAMEALTPGQREAAAETLGELAPPVPAAEILTAAGAARLPHIGFHTVRHHPLTGLDDAQLEHALTEGRTGLGNVAGYPVDTIAYPHGSWDSRVVEAARESNFSIGVTCEREAVTPGADPLALGRYEPPVRASTGEFAFDLARTLLISPSS